MEISSKHCLSQTVRARDLKFLEKVHHLMLHLSHTTCHFDMSLFFSFLFLIKCWSLSLEGLSPTELPLLVYSFLAGLQWALRLFSLTNCIFAVRQSPNPEWSPGVGFEHRALHCTLLHATAFTKPPLIGSRNQSLHRLTFMGTLQVRTK